MIPDNDIESFDEPSEGDSLGDPASVDDFLRELEAKERDLQISGEYNLIEVADALEPDELPDFLKQEMAARAVTVPTAAAPALDERTHKLESENSMLRSKVEVLETERTELVETAQRRIRDFDGYKARSERERAEFASEQTANFAAQMLPVLDNLVRAVGFGQSQPEEKLAGFRQFFDGISMVTKQVNELLADMGVEPIKAVGEPFDPHLHEAVAVEASEQFPHNVVCEELLCGYKIGDRVIRHSMVKVVGDPAATATNTETSSDEA